MLGGMVTGHAQEALAVFRTEGVACSSAGVPTLTRPGLVVTQTLTRPLSRLIFGALSECLALEAPWGRVGLGTNNTPAPGRLSPAGHHCRLLGSGQTLSRLPARAPSPAFALWAQLPLVETDGGPDPAGTPPAPRAHLGGGRALTPSERLSFPAGLSQLPSCPSLPES